MYSIQVRKPNLEKCLLHNNHPNFIDHIFRSIHTGLLVKTALRLQTVKEQ